MTRKAPTEFTVKVIAAIRRIPKGKVSTYGAIAAMAGKPHGARGVSWILHSSSETKGLPWHRVVGSPGRISLPRDSRSYATQKKRLEAEGVEVSDSGEIDLGRFQWKKPKKRRG